jgi:hypothetical protein
MRIMRSLVILLFTFHALLGNKAFADQQMASDTSYSSGLYRSQLGYRDNGILGLLNVTAGFVTAQKDYSTYLVYDEDGNEHPLEQNKRLEHTLLAGLEVQTSMLGLYISGNYMLSDSPLRSYGYSLGADFSPNNGISLIEISYTKMAQHAPESFVVNPDTFETIHLPSLVHADEIKLTYTQAVNEIVKYEIEASTVHREEERPRSYGLGLALAVGLSDHLFLKQGIKKYWDVHQELKTDRGYFDLASADVELAYEPIYNAYISASYGFQFEAEQDPRNKLEKHDGCEFFGLSAGYKKDSTAYRLLLLESLPKQAHPELTIGIGSTYFF